MIDKDYRSGIPDAICILAEGNIEQVRRAFEGMMSVARKNAATIEWRSTAAHAGMRGLWQKAAEFAEKNVATSLEFARQLARVDDPHGLLKVHADFAQQQMRTAVEQMSELSQVLADVLVDAKRAER